MLAQSMSGATYYLICAILCLIILGMAANEWRRLGRSRYLRLALAAGVLLVGRAAGVMVLLLEFQPLAAFQEWALESLTLSVFIWAFLFDSFTSPRRRLLFLALSSAVTGGGLVLCLLLWIQIPSLPWITAAWLAGLLLLSVFGLMQWMRHRQRFSVWLGIAFLLFSLGAVGGLLGFPQGTMLFYLAALTLFVIETYRAILDDFGKVGRELGNINRQTLRHTQEVVYLLEVGRAISASLDLPLILERVSEAVTRAVDADWAYVLLPVEENLEQLTVAARYGWWGRRWMQESRLSKTLVIDLADFSLIRHAFLRQRQVLANQPQDYEQFERLHDPLARPQNGPVLVQPVHLGHRSLSVLILGRIETAPREAVVGKRSFDDADAELCQALAAQVAAAIDNARRYQEMESRAVQGTELLRAREEKIIQFQAILESIADGVIVAERDGEVILANAAAERILDMPRQKLLDQAIKRLITQLLQVRERHGRDGAVFQWGDQVMMGSLSPVKMLDGTLLGYVAVFRDVTRERQAEQARAEFLATVSQELRTLLTSIKEGVALLAADAEGDVVRERGELRAVIDASTDRMGGLVHNLMAIAEMEQGVLQIEPESVDMRNVIEEAVQGRYAETETGHPAFDLNLPPDLSPVWGDPVWLRQIVDNLLENALRATPANGDISIWAVEAGLDDEGASPDGCLVVSIRDASETVPAEEQNQMSEEPNSEISGLSAEALEAEVGLAVAKSLVEAHGGRLWVERQSGAGQICSFSIPTASGSR